MARATGIDGGGDESDSYGQSSGRFPPTHWSMVISAGKDSSPDARQAFGRLYEAYRSALLVFLRRQGRTEDEAGELVQGFFESLLEHKSLGKVHPEGRFRSWLLVCLKHYLSDLWDKGRAIKRGGDQPHLQLGVDLDKGEVEPPHRGRTPDQEYDREFALRFVSLVMTRLEQEYIARGKAQLFQELRPWLQEKKAGMSQAEAGRRLGMSEGAVTQEVSRLRKRFRDVFDEELEELVGSPVDVAAEKRFLFAALLT